MISIKKISHTLLGNLLEFAAGFGITTFVTFSYSTKDAGKWMWIMAIIAVQAKIREGITQTALVKFACNGEINEQFIQRKLNFLITILFELTLFLFLYLISFWQTGEYIQWYLAYGVYSICTALFRWQMFLWQGTLKTIEYLKSQFLTVILTVSGTLFCYLNQKDLVTLTYILGTSKFLAVLPFISFSEKIKTFNSSISWKQIKDMQAYAGFGLLRETTGSIASRAEMLIGGLLLTFTEVAWLGLAARYAQLFLLPNSAIQSLVNTRAHALANTNIESMKILLGQTLTGLWFLFGFCVLLFGLTAQFWVPIVHGAQYNDAIPIIILLLIHTTLFVPTGGVFGTIAHALNQPLLTAKVVLISSIIKITLTAMALWYFGIWGGVFIPFVVEIWGIYYTGSLMKKYLQTSWSELVQLGISQANSIRLEFQKTK